MQATRRRRANLSGLSFRFLSLSLSLSLSFYRKERTVRFLARSPLSSNNSPPGRRRPVSVRGQGSQPNKPCQRTTNSRAGRIRGKVIKRRPKERKERNEKASLLMARDFRFASFNCDRQNRN